MMKAVQKVLIRIPKTHDETIKTKGGIELWVEIRFNEAKYRHETGFVVDAPERYKDVLPNGTQVWFHQLVTNLQNPRLAQDDVYYAIADDTEADCITSQIFAYKQNPEDEIKPFGWFVLVEPIGSTENSLSSSTIELISLKNKVDDLGVVAAINPFVSEKYGVVVGDKVVYNSSARYAIHDGDKMYYRVRPQSILYKNIEEEIMPCGDFVLMDMDKAKETSESGIFLPTEMVEHPNIGKVFAINPKNSTLEKSIVGATVMTNKNCRYIPAKDGLFFVDCNDIIATYNG